MPKTPVVNSKQSKRFKPTTYSRPPAKSVSKPRTEPAPPSTSPTSSSSDTASALTLDRHLVLRIILAKLESSKTCDWHELSLKLSGTSGHAQNDTTGGKKGTIKAKGKGKKDVMAQGLSGTELREMYHKSILPSLRAGRALWTDDNTHQTPIPLTPISASAGTLTTNTARDQEITQEGGSDEEVSSDHESVDETIDAKVPRGSSEVARPTRVAKARKSYAQEYEDWDAEQSDESESMGSESE